VSVGGCRAGEEKFKFSLLVWFLRLQLIQGEIRSYKSHFPVGPAWTSEPFVSTVLAPIRWPLGYGERMTS
jgi:hypothetical protein